MTAIKHFLQASGYAGWAIVATGFILVAIAAERIHFLYFRSSFESSQAFTNLRTLILGRNFTRALQVCNQEPENPELKVIKSGLLAVESGREAMKSALSAAVLHTSELCEARLGFLSLIASASTLLGLLGTIMGLISTFSAIASADAGEKARLLGAGISEAMTCTAAGLVVGLAAMAAHAVCVAKTDTIVGKTQRAGLSLITWIEESERGQRAG